MSHPSSGIYERDGIGYVSVSDVLGRTLEVFNPGKARSLEHWRQTEPDAIEILERGQRRGTIVHHEVELNLTGQCLVHKEDAPTYEEMVGYNINGYMLYLVELLQEIKDQNKNKSNLLIEKPSFCRLGWGGTPDLRLMWNGIYTIWDWKSTRSCLEEGVKKKPKSKSHYTEAFIQEAAYAISHNIEDANDKLPKIEQAVTCVCYDWREPHLFVLDKEQLKEAAATYIERFDMYQQITGNRFPIKMDS